MEGKLFERVRQAREHARLTQDQLAKHVGMRQQSYGDLESGKTLSSRKLTQIAIRCGVDPVWLATGEGEMIQSQAMRDWAGRIDSRRRTLGLSVPQIHAAVMQHSRERGIEGPDSETVGRWFSGHERPREMYLQALYQALQMDLDEAARDTGVQVTTAEEAEWLRQFRALSPEERVRELMVMKVRRGDP
jgi:DNA-binding XRE family transcriptional regulator